MLIDFSLQQSIFPARSVQAGFLLFGIKKGFPGTAQIEPTQANRAKYYIM